MKNILRKFNMFFLIICTISVFHLQTNAYTISSEIPGTKTLTWGWHTLTPSAGRVLASGNWNTSDGLKATYNFQAYTGNIDPYDSKNSVGAPVLNAPGMGSTWIAATLLPVDDGYTTFDIVVHSTCTFGNGSSETYYDYAGVYTHEFGHVFGLNDLYGYSPEVWGQTKSTVPTMYGYNYFDGTNNIYYYSRTTQTDDNNGKRVVAGSIS